VSKIIPLITDYTQIRKLNIPRMTAQAIEAAEQSERLSVPQIEAPLNLHEVIDHIKSPIFWADESKIGAQPFPSALKEIKGHHLLVGPEGGFSEKEKDYLRQQKHIIPVALGPQILRAETASIVMLALYQALQGSWRTA
jgi:16S rRNA (uracil1498-N3)-methyltransferase